MCVCVCVGEPGLETARPHPFINLALLSFLQATLSDFPPGRAFFRLYLSTNTGSFTSPGTYLSLSRAMSLCQGSTPAGEREASRHLVFSLVVFLEGSSTYPICITQNPWMLDLEGSLVNWSNLSSSEDVPSALSVWRLLQCCLGTPSSDALCFARCLPHGGQLCFRRTNVDLHVSAPSSF